MIQIKGHISKGDDNASDSTGTAHKPPVLLKDTLMTAKTNKSVEIAGTHYEMLGTMNDGDCKVRLKNSKGEVVEMTCDSFIDQLNNGTARYL
mgnify:FL=1